MTRVERFVKVVDERKFQSSGKEDEYLWKTTTILSDVAIVIHC